MPPEFDRHAEMDEAVDWFWDQASRSHVRAAGDLDPADAAAIRHLHAHDDRPAPNPAFIRQLREELMHAHAIQVSSSPAVLPIPNGRAGHPRPIGPLPSPSSRRQWVLAQLATAALLLLTLIGSMVVFGPNRSGQGPRQPAALPAISSTPATPETAAPIAEFVWKSEGSADVPLGPPGLPAVDPQGNLWIPDSENGRFIILSPEGAVLETWGTPGDGDGEFDFECGDSPYGAVAFDAAGNIYVADADNQRVQKFGPDRAFLTSWGSAGTGDGQFLCPADLAIDEQGRVYVTDSAWGKVEVFDADGAWLATLSDMLTPLGIAIDGDGNVWVADDAGEVVKMAPDGQRLATWEAGLPSDVAIDAEGRVFVADPFTNRIEILSPEATLLGGWGVRGDGDGEFKGVSGIALDGKGSLYTVDSDRLQVRAQKFLLLPPFGPEDDPATGDVPATPETSSSPLADLLWQTANAGGIPLAWPTGAAIDPQGNIWVTDGGNDRIVIFAPGGQVLSPQGVVLETWGTPGSGEGEFDFADTSCEGLQLASVAFDAAGNIYVADSGNHRIQKFAPDRTFLTSWGAAGGELGHAFCPLSVVVDRQDRVYVGDHTGNTIEVFDTDGRALATWTEDVGRPEQLAIDGDGNIWMASTSTGIVTYSPDGEIVGGWRTSSDGDGIYNSPMGIAVDGQGRVFVSGQGARVQVFSADGEFLGSWGERGRDPGRFSEPSYLVLDEMGNIYTVDLFGHHVQKFRLLSPLGSESGVP